MVHSHHHKSAGSSGFCSLQLGFPKPWGHPEARLGFGKQVERCQGPQIMKCFLTRVRVGCLSCSPTLWTKKSVMIIQTLPPVTGSILLPELLSIRTTSGASSITVRKELKETAWVWHFLLGSDSESERAIWPVSLSSPDSNLLFFSWEQQSVWTTCH